MSTGQDTTPGTAAVLARSSRAEWSRIWTVRSSWLFAAATAVAVVGLSALIGVDAAKNPSGISADDSAWDGGRFTAMFALFGVLALSVVTSTSDHSTGAIVPTLQWTPRRPLLLVSRAGVIVATATLLGVVLVGLASAVIAMLVAQVGLPVGEGAEVLGGIALVLATGSALAVGIGLLLRSTAGAMVTVIALVLVLPPLLAQLPFSWAADLSALMPGSNALFLIFGEGPSDDMTVTSARLTSTAWAAAALVAGGARLLRADANR